MLREGLAAEFPFARRMLLSIRRARIAREHPRWAGVSGFGAAWLVVTGGQAIATLIRVAGFRDPAAWVAGALTVLGVSFGVAVALRAGGRGGLYWYGAGLLAVAGLTLGAQLPAYLDICSRQLGLECSPVQLVLPHLRTLGGLLLGPVAVRFVTGGASGRNPVLNAAGAFALAGPVVVTLWRLTSYAPTGPTSALVVPLVFVVVGMLAAGVVMRMRTASARAAIVFGGFMLAVWVAQQGPFVWDIARGAFVVTSPVSFYSVLVGPVELAAFTIGWILPKLARPDDGSGLVEMRGIVERDDQDPAARGELP